MKRIFLLSLFGFLLPSCGVVFYSYRGFFETEFSIPNEKNDTAIRYEAAKLIYKLSAKEDFYTRHIAPNCDSLYFYGPDYHEFDFKLSEKNKVTRVKLKYFGYNGWRSRPPHRNFIQSVTDSLKTEFGATQIIIMDISNEKKRRKTGS